MVGVLVGVLPYAAQIAPVLVTGTIVTVSRNSSISLVRLCHN
jgi:hypothetical protein